MHLVKTAPLLDPVKKKEEKKFSLVLERDGDLLLLKNGKKIKVNIKPCFPWSTPGKYFSLVNKDGEEEVFVANSRSLDQASKNAIDQSLAEAGFSFTIKKILKIEEEFELRRWWVETAQGERQFQTKLLDWPREIQGGGLLIQDVHGDLFYIKDPAKLPLPGRDKLSAFID